MQTIGKYEVLDKVGSGGFAVVYKGYDPFIKRTIAIKVCFSHDDEVRKRFHREAEIAGRLAHRNIAMVFDFGVHEDMPYLVEEYLSGEDLATLIRRREPVHLAEKLDILLQVADGLSYAHGRGIVHRDIKPGNVRVLDNGMIKIMDFGTAKRTGSESHLTQTGTTLGTVAYLSPERMRGKRAAPTSDLFSLGVLAYELMVFQRPFVADNVTDMIERILEDEPTPLDQVWPEAPQALSELIDRCLAKDPTTRPASCAELIAVLESVRDEAVGTPSQPSSPDAGLVPVLIARARRRLQDGRITVAAALVEEALDIAPEDTDAQALWAEISGHDGSASEPAPASTAPDAGADRKIAEACASIEQNLAEGRVNQAGAALDFAVHLLGDFEGAESLRQRIAGQRERSEDEGTTEDASTAPPTGRDPEDDDEIVALGPRRRAEAIHSIERFCELGQPELAREALDFAIGLYGEFEEVPDLEQQIEASLLRRG